MNNEIAKNENNLSLIISDAAKQASMSIDQRVELLLTSNLKGFSLSIAKANVVNEISKVISSEVMKPIMCLQNKKYGFKTDSKNGYGEEVVKDCLIEAVFRGLEPTGNQFNIIGGNCYTTQEGCTHLLTKLGYFCDVSYQLSKKNENGVTTIETTIEWTKNGLSDSKTIVFPVKVFDGVTTEEAIRGKAERKIKAWLYEYLTGVQIISGDVDKTVDGIAEEIKPNFTKQKQDLRPKPKQEDYVEELKDIEEVKGITNVQKANEAQQKRFDKYIDGSISKEMLIERTTQVLNNFKLSLESFDLTIYNKKMNEYAK